MTLVQHADPYPHWLFTDPATGDRLRLVPERGGLITGWECGGHERLYFDQQRFADPALSVRGGIPVLCPICGGVPDHPLPQHGFARDRPWTIGALEGADSGVRLQLKDSPETLLPFPHPFLLTLEVRLRPAALEIEAVVENTGTDLLPFSFGLHPYFQVSSLESVTIEGLPPRVLDQVSGDQVPLSEGLAALAAGVDLLAGPAGPVRLVDAVAGEVITLEPTAPLDLTVVWTDPPRSMVCLEPWSAPRGALLSGDRLLRLAPGDSLRLRTRYALTAL
jgi:D-hexose-6-phosphate mutarotase